METEKITINVPVDFFSDNVVATVRPVSGKEPLLGFVQLDFGLIKIRGIRVRAVDFKRDGNPTVILDFPAYRAGRTFLKSVFITDKRVYFKICEEVLKEFPGIKSAIQAEINFDDIPF